MDYLEEREDEGQKIESINRLRQRKQYLAERLEKLRNQKFDIDAQDINKVGANDVVECKEILDIYRLHGVCIKSMGPDLVLRFDPLYRNQYPNTEHYSVQILRKGDNFNLGKHNLPPFIPASQLLETCSGNGIEEFTEEIRKFLYAYTQRREGFKQAKEMFAGMINEKLDIDLAALYVKFQLRILENLPEMEVTLQYSLDKCLPDTVEVAPVEDEETHSVSKKTLGQTIKKIRQTLFNKDILTALTEIVR